MIAKNMYNVMARRDRECLHVHKNSVFACYDLWGDASIKGANLRSANTVN